MSRLVRQAVEISRGYLRPTYVQSALCQGDYQQNKVAPKYYLILMTK